MTERVSRIKQLVSTLPEGQLALLESILETFGQPVSSYTNPVSDVVNSDFLPAFGDILKLHHSLSDDYLDKYRFEAAMHRVYKALGRDASRPGRCFPGHDLTVDGVKWSLKTQGDRQIKQDFLHISKYMELGKGKWKTKRDLFELRDSFLKHLTAYERIFQLRYFNLESDSMRHFYELVEIPKVLLLEACDGAFEMMKGSKQTPKPGYCRVTDSDGLRKFELYFDGGSERKLQIKHLRKNLCIVHATWQF